MPPRAKAAAPKARQLLDSRIYQAAWPEVQGAPSCQPLAASDDELGDPGPTQYSPAPRAEDLAAIIRSKDKEKLKNSRREWAKSFLEASRQRRQGAQSKRGGASQTQLSVLEGHAHARECFEFFAKQEEQMCEEWAVFYHSYSYAALIYELQAAVAATLFNFDSCQCSLPRIIFADFLDTPDATSLMEAFSSRFQNQRQDHNPLYRAAAISAMASLVALGPEVSTPVMFLAGWSQEDVKFNGVLEKACAECYIPQARLKKFAADIIQLASEHGIDVSWYGGKPYEGKNPGHLLQIFIRRWEVDELAYAAKPYGEPDSERQPLSRWLDSDVSTNFGQVRIVAHPFKFMDPDVVRMNIASADPKFHKRRPIFQKALIKLVNEAFNEPSVRESARTGIANGVRPEWWVEKANKELSQKECAVQ